MQDPFLSLLFNGPPCGGQGDVKVRSHDCEDPTLFLPVLLQILLSDSDCLEQVGGVGVGNK